MNISDSLSSTPLTEFSSFEHAEAAVAEFCEARGYARFLGLHRPSRQMISFPSASFSGSEEKLHSADSLLLKSFTNKFLYSTSDYDWHPLDVSGRERFYGEGVPVEIEPWLIMREATTVKNAKDAISEVFCEGGLLGALTLLRLQFLVMREETPIRPSFLTLEMRRRLFGKA